MITPTVILLGGLWLDGAIESEFPATMNNALRRQPSKDKNLGNLYPYNSFMQHVVNTLVQ